MCNALAPAEISRVIIDEDNRSMEVIVPDEYLSIAIGKKGQNVRLASKLSGWHLDVKNETRYSQAMQIGYDSLVALAGVGIGLADALYESGYYSAEEISRATIEDLIQIRGIGEEKAEKLLEAARNAIAQSETETTSTGVPLMLIVHQSRLRIVSSGENSIHLASLHWAGSNRDRCLCASQRL